MKTKQQFTGLILCAWALRIVATLVIAGGIGGGLFALLSKPQTVDMSGTGFPDITVDYRSYGVPLVAGGLVGGILLYGIGATFAAVASIATSSADTAMALRSRAKAPAPAKTAPTPAPAKVTATADGFPDF